MREAAHATPSAVSTGVPDGATTWLRIVRTTMSTATCRRSDESGSPERSTDAVTTALALSSNGALSFVSRASIGGFETAMCAVVDSMILSGVL